MKNKKNITQLTLLFISVICILGYTNKVSIKKALDYKVIQANGIPNHEPGTFPNANTPNTVKPQSYHLKITNPPKTNTITMELKSEIKLAIQCQKPGHYILSDNVEITNNIPIKHYTLKQLQKEKK